MTAEHERATGIIVESAPRAPAAAVGVVAVVPGEGFAHIARSLGASPLRGGPTMNPSTEELLAAITATNAKTVVVLPNDKNVILAAQQAAKVSTVTVHVVPTRNVAQGMAALVAFDPAKEPAENAKVMAEVADRAHGIEVTRAVRDATIDGEHVKKGEAIALLDGRVVAHGEDEVTVLCDAAKRRTVPRSSRYSGETVDEPGRARGHALACRLSACLWRWRAVAARLPLSLTRSSHVTGGTLARSWRPRAGSRGTRARARRRSRRVPRFSRAREK